MKRIMQMIESLLGAGNNRRSVSLPTPQMTEGRMWEISSRRSLSQVTPREPKPKHD
ncbi:MAG: hypothetical protein R3F39_18130 [Myxococcota bacterium]